MIPILQLPYRKSQELADEAGLKPWLVALILALILGFQIGLVVWVFFNHWAVSH